MRTRDGLIAAQESLLNTYRCRFNIDTQVVPGGCRGGQPANRPAVPPPFNGAPTAEANRVRDELIASQESLLNIYRCRFNIDTQVVPGGCRGGQPANRLADNGSSSGGQSLSVSPASVPAAGVYDFTVTGYGFTVSKANIVVCQTSDVSLVRNSADFFSYCGGFGEQIAASAGGIFSTTLNGVTVGDAGVSFLLFEFASDGEAASFTIAPTGPVAITVPNSEPEGRCASAISAISEKVYSWETCAWKDYLENKAHNPSISDQQAPRLISRIWSEVVVAGKPANPPTAELVPAGTQCALPDKETQTIGCYMPRDHHIRRLDSSLKTLLHEVAHALVAGNETITECGSLGGNAYQSCVHKDIFRCVANHLYVEYGGIPDAGVCGTAASTTSPPTGAWQNHRNEDGSFIAWVPIHKHNMKDPYEGVNAYVIVICSSGDLDVYLQFEGAYLYGQTQHNFRIPAHYFFLPDEFWEWDQQRRDAYEEANKVRSLWNQSLTKTTALVPDDERVEFIKKAVAPDNDWGNLNLFDFFNEPFGGFLFKTEGAYTSIKPVTEECGWKWS